MIPSSKQLSVSKPEVVARAERFSRERRLPFTPMRRRVLDELVSAQAPLTAYELAERVSTERRVAPVQVYRALEFLRSAGVIHRLATRGAFIVCDHEHCEGETVVFLLCADCGSVAETSSSAVGRGLDGAAAANRFEALNPVVEVEGRCGLCRGLH